MFVFLYSDNCVLIIMWAIIAIQWFQINHLKERLNPTKEKIEILSMEP